MAYKSWEEELAAQNAELARLREQNMAAQGQVSQTPFFQGPAYDPAAAQAGTGRGALSIRGNEIGYYGNGQWNSLGAAPQAGTPEVTKSVQPASYEGDQEAPMMAAQANMPAPTTKSYGFSQPPSWAPRVNTSDPTQSNFLGGQVTRPQGPALQPMAPPQGGLLNQPAQQSPAFGAGTQGGLSGFGGMPMNSFWSRYWGR